MALIELKDINKTYNNGQPLHVLKGINLNIEKGEFVSIMGASGSGKSTLLNILGILDNYDTGTYTLGGTLIKDLSEKQAADYRNHMIGFIFQSFNLIDELTVEQNVELPLKYMGISADMRAKKVAEALRRMNISHRAKHYPDQLSGAQQQRVAIARAVVTEPEIILADEPTGNLDSKNGKEVMDLLAELNDDGTTIVMVTHSQRDASYAHRIVNMLDGFLVERTEL